MNRFLPFLGSSTQGSCLEEVIAGVSTTIGGVCLGGGRTGCDKSEDKTHHLPLDGRKCACEP